MWVWYIITNISARMNHRKVGTDCVRMICWWVSNVTNTVITFRCILGWFFCLFSVYFRPFLIPIWITISITNKRSQWISKWNSFLVNDQCHLNPSAKMLHCRAVIFHWYLSTLWNSNPVQLVSCAYVKHSLKQSMVARHVGLERLMSATVILLIYQYFISSSIHTGTFYAVG